MTKNTTRRCICCVEVDVCAGGGEVDVCRVVEGDVCAGVLRGMCALGC